MESWVALVTALLAAIPILYKVFHKTSINKESEIDEEKNQEKREVSDDHAKAREDGRPKGDFWEKRDGMH